MNDRQLIADLLSALEYHTEQTRPIQFSRVAIEAAREYLRKPAQPEPVLQDIEQYRLQMAGICTAAIGYWKEGDGIHPDYDTVALRDVAKLYAKYDELYRAQPAQQEPVSCEEDHPNSRFLFKRLCGVAGIEMGKDTVPQALDKIAKLREAQRTWVGLTDAQSTVIWANSKSVDEAIRATEERLKENNK